MSLELRFGRLDLTARDKARSPVPNNINVGGSGVVAATGVTFAVRPVKSPMKLALAPTSKSSVCPVSRWTVAENGTFCPYEVMLDVKITAPFERIWTFVFAGNCSIPDHAPLTV